MHSSITVFEDLNHLNYCFMKNKIGIRRECQGLRKSEFYKKYILASSVMTYIIPYVAPFTTIHTTGEDPGFQVRGGAFKTIAPSGGRRENCWVFRVKNYDFTPKNHIFSNCGGRRENCSCEKSRFYAKKSYFFQF